MSLDRELLDATEAAFAALGRGAPLPAGDELDEALLRGAVSAVASKFLAVATPRTIGVIGDGAVARAQLAAHRISHAPRELRTTDAALAFDERGRLTSIEEACACDIVCVSIEARIERAWIRSGTHLDAGPAILDEALIHDSKIVVGDDDVAQAELTEPGAGPVGEGVAGVGAGQPSTTGAPVARSRVWATLGDVAAGMKDGRELDEISIFVAGSLARVKRAVAAFLPRR